MAPMEVPPYLKGLLPQTIQGLAIADAGESGNQYKLVSFSRWPKTKDAYCASTSQILLVAMQPGGSAKLLWKSENEELYAPQNN